MDLNSTSKTSNDLVFRIFCDVRQCKTGFPKNGWNGGILFHDYNQGLSGYRSKWLGGQRYRNGYELGLGLWLKMGYP